VIVAISLFSLARWPPVLRLSDFGDELNRVINFVRLLSYTVVHHSCLQSCLILAPHLTVSLHDIIMICNITIVNLQHARVNARLHRDDTTQHNVVTRPSRAHCRY